MVIENSLQPDSSPTMARLQIHGMGGPGSTGATVVQMLRSMRAFCLHGRLPRKCASTRLCITDAHGRQVFSLEDAGPLIVVPLPAGTYHVTAQNNQARRSYTMTLYQGSSVNLHVRFSHDQD